MDEPKIEILEISGGNTKVPPKLQQNQLLNWCFTFNNYSVEDIEILETYFKQFCFKYCFQEETGPGTDDKPGTPHLQGVISLKKRARWSEFGLPRTMHWEACKSVTKAYLYCSKIETRTGQIFAMNYTLPYNIEIQKFYDWENDLIQIMKEKPDDRFIHWVHEPDGNRGKTTFQKWVYCNFEKVVVLSGKGADMKNGVVEYKKKTGNLPKIILINIPKSVDSDFISYTGIEEVKDMFFYSGKYEGGMVCGENPHVFIFSNEVPNISKMSKDRWKVVNI